MRALFVLVVTAFLAGCVSAPASTPTSTLTNVSNVTSKAPTPNATVGGTGERSALGMERFVLSADHSISVPQPGAPEPPASNVPESSAVATFVLTNDASTTLKPWLGASSHRSFEAFGDVPITLRIVSAQSSAALTKGVQFPAVGGWFGTKERWAVYFSAPDAPDTLEAGKTYTLKMTAKLPAGGFFIKDGEQLALHTYLGYQTPDNSPVSYVVGGPDPAGFALPHAHFNVTAPTATVILDKKGTLSPNPAVSTTSDPQPTDISFDVPAGTQYLVADLVGTATGGDRVDADLALRAGAETLGSGSGPSPHEVVELGPTAIAKAGGKLTAHVAGVTPSGGTFRLTVTAYGP